MSAFLKLAGVGVLLISSLGCRKPGRQQVEIQIPLIEQDATSRAWRNVTLDSLHYLPVDDSVMLYNPGSVLKGPGKNVYVGDYGDMSVKAFDKLGRYTTTYGRGMGWGPGEVQQMGNLGTIGDSVVFIYDSMHRRLTYFQPDGSLSTIEQPEKHFNRMVVTNSGRKYWSIPSDYRYREFFVTSSNVDTLMFGRLLDESLHVRNKYLIPGELRAYGEDLLFVPDLYPALIRFNSDGEVKYARRTIGAVGFEPPEEMVEQNGMRWPGPPLNYSMFVNDDQVVVLVRDNKDRRMKMIADYYDAGSGNYNESVKLPDGFFKLLTDERAYEIRDTVVVVYRLLYR